MGDLKIATWNVRGLNSYLKRNKIMMYIHRQKIDIALLQETHLTKKKEEIIKKKWKGTTIFGIHERGNHLDSTACPLPAIAYHRRARWEDGGDTVIDRK